MAAPKRSTPTCSTIGRSLICLEYLPARWAGREWLSGFTGSVGIADRHRRFRRIMGRWPLLVASRSAIGRNRYRPDEAFLLGSSTQHIDWLGETMKPGQTVGVDGAVLGLAGGARLLQQALIAKGALLRTDLRLCWKKSGPAARDFADRTSFANYVAPHAPKSRAAKLAAVREAMNGYGAQWHFISTLDDIAYLFNLRGSDVNYNPIFVAHALVGPERTSLFVAEGKVPPALQAILTADGVDVLPYPQAPAALAALPAGATLLLDPRRITLGLRNAVPETPVIVKEAHQPHHFRQIEEE